MGSMGSERVEMFEYPAGPDAPSLPSWECWEVEGAADSLHESAREHPRGANDAQMHAEFEKRLAEDARRSFDAGCERGRQMEREAQAGAQAGADQRRMHQVSEAIEKFVQERDRYLQAIECEVVALALAVAARVLRREAQMDPLLLTGAVRVALGQLSSSTQVKLRVPSGELDLWTESIALFPNLQVKPVVLVGEGMRLGECLIETELGSVDVGIRAQLGEIERGFFDRAGGRNAVAAVSQQEDIAVPAEGARR